MLAFVLLPFLSGFFLTILYQQRCPNGLLDCYKTLPLPTISEAYENVIGPVKPFVPSSSWLNSYHHYHHYDLAQPHGSPPSPSSMVKNEQDPHPQLQIIVEIPEDVMETNYLANHPTLTLAYQPTSNQIRLFPTAPSQPKDVELESNGNGEMISPSLSNGIQIIGSTLQSLFSEDARANSRAQMSKVVEEYVDHPVVTFHEHFLLLKQSVEREIRDLEVDRNAVINTMIGYYLAIALKSLVKLMARGLYLNVFRLIFRALARIYGSTISLFRKRSDQSDHDDNHLDQDHGRPELPELKANQDLKSLGNGALSADSATTTSQRTQSNSDPVASLSPFTPSCLNRTTSLPRLSPTSRGSFFWKEFDSRTNQISHLNMTQQDLALHIPSAFHGQSTSQVHSDDVEEETGALGPYLMDTAPTLNVNGFLAFDNYDDTSSSATLRQSPRSSPDVADDDLKDDVNEKVVSDQSLMTDHLPFTYEGMVKEDLEQHDANASRESDIIIANIRSRALVATNESLTDFGHDYVSPSPSPSPSLHGDAEEDDEETEAQPSHSEVPRGHKKKRPTKHKKNQSTGGSQDPHVPGHKRNRSDQSPMDNKRERLGGPQPTSPIQTAVVESEIDECTVEREEENVQNSSLPVVNESTSGPSRRSSEEADASSSASRKDKGKSPIRGQEEENQKLIESDVEHQPRKHSKDVEHKSTEILPSSNPISGPTEAGPSRAATKSKSTNAGAASQKLPHPISRQPSEERDTGPSSKRKRIRGRKNKKGKVTQSDIEATPPSHSTHEYEPTPSPPSATMNLVDDIDGETEDIESVARFLEQESIKEEEREEEEEVEKMLWDL
ncbi:hypothetical protein I203_108114 [Kwoniella mangroviensis CBS 8507]|uniref:hypothetical protein n=1 Tax=Kwoniella mangroviensis CBS 8507 TaxID=1296122 RepID=UPI003061DCBC